MYFFQKIWKIVRCFFIYFSKLQVVSTSRLVVCKTRFYLFFQNIVPLDWCGFWPANDLDRSPNFVSSMTNQNGGDHPINQNGNGGALTSSVENIRTTSMERQSVLARSALEKGTFKAPPEWREYVAGGAAQGFNICITFPIHKTMFRWGHATCKDLYFTYLWHSLLFLLQRSQNSKKKW